ncbi:MAG TPA: HlyD family efflux transporter periplasmic adaptor subunit [Polyangiales bacterium]|nr:HlyD family efflux transporter periplasmic adaptor subunit [Polyangiales bacterium]
MTDRWLLAFALVPMTVGTAMVALFSRAPAVSVAASPAPRVAKSEVPPLTESAEQEPWVGVVVAGTTAELAADAEGHVAEVFVQNGARVAEGDKLLQFDADESSSAVGIASAELGERRSEVARAEAKAEAAHAQLERLRAGAAWISKQELENGEAEARLADAELRAASASVSMGRARVSQQRMRRDRRVLTAPFTGTVASVEVDLGDSVVAGQVVLRMVSNDRQVRFAFPPGELVERQVAIKLKGTELAISAQVTELRPEIDPSAQLVFATAALPADLPEAARWIPGAPAQVFRTPKPLPREGY